MEFTLEIAKKQCIIKSNAAFSIVICFSEEFFIWM